MDTSHSAGNTTTAREKYRPLVHFAPRAGWINDPNGLVYHNGVYHLFFQHHPWSNDLGPMHWGHARSQDLIVWEELPVALAPDHNGVIFSGSAITDWANSSGLGAGALVAAFTSHDDAAQPVERQSLAFSNDGGHTFAKFSGNPVLFPPPHTPDFRDPRLLWYGESDGHWVMALAAGDEVHFYRSDDLKTWMQTGAFGRGQGAHGGVWECPDLFSLQVEGEEDRHWVLVVGINPGGQALGSGTQYFVGSFDGSTFVNANAPETVLWLDWGADAYATQSWDGAPHGRRIVTSWMSNWHYARQTPTSPWRGSMTLPRDLSLMRTDDGLRVAQRPVAELANYWGDDWRVEPVLLAADHILAFAAPPLACFDLSIEMALGEGVRRAGVRLRDGWGNSLGDSQGDSQGDSLRGVVTAAWEAESGRVWVDRSASGVVDFHADFAARHGAPFTPAQGRLSLRLVVDAASLELFAGNGEVAITESLYPYEGRWTVELFSEGGGVEAAAQLRALGVGLPQDAAN